MVLGWLRAYSTVVNWPDSESRPRGVVFDSLFAMIFPFARVNGCPPRDNPAGVFDHRYSYTGAVEDPLTNEIPARQSDLFQ